MQRENYFFGTKKSKKIIVAEYIIDNNVYQTREMVIPLSKVSDKALNIDDDVMVKYYPSKPHHSMIANDIYSFKTAKNLLIITVAMVLTLISLYFYQVIK